VRTPQNTLVAVLAAALGAAVGVVCGGLGGFAVKLRALRQRIDGHDDELERVSVRVSRREGADGRARQQATTSKLEAEAEKVLAALSTAPGRRNGAAAPSSDAELLMLADRVWGPRGGKREADE
jgi:hypothetical protein